MDGPAARALAEHLSRVEDRLGRLLASGWRHASDEAAALRSDAEALAEAGLTSVAERAGAVADATTSSEALRAISLASSACQLLRARLPADDPPDGWLALESPKRAKRAGEDTLLPLAKVRCDGAEVWACARPGSRRWLLLDPPPLASDAASSTGPVAAGTSAEAEHRAAGKGDGGLLGRARRRVREALGLAGAGSPWLRHHLRGRLEWRATYPLGTRGEVARCVLDGARWVDDDTGAEAMGPFRDALAAGKLADDSVLFSNWRGFRVRALDRDVPGAYTWLDPSMRSAFLGAPDGPAWALAWLEGNEIVPVALLTSGGLGRPARLIHLVPGTPSDVVSPRSGNRSG